MNNEIFSRNVNMSKNNNSENQSRVNLLVFLLIFGVAIMSLSGCKPPSPIPKEGDVVIWRHTPGLIIKAELGQRREHVVTNEKYDSLLYEAHYEKFIGQFPIDYVPKPFPKFTKAEHAAYEVARKNKKIPWRNTMNYIEFYLMLNGVTTKATDLKESGRNGLDDPNQVIVMLNHHGTRPIITKSGVKRDPYNTQQFFERVRMKQLDVSSKKTQYGLDCYHYNYESRGQRCFGHSTHPLVSGFEFYLSSYDFSKTIMVTSQEFIYGGIEVQWVTNKNNINRARDIDAAIWRLLDAWNISPLTTPIQHNN